MSVTKLSFVNTFSERVSKWNARYKLKVKLCTWHCFGQVSLNSFNVRHVTLPNAVVRHWVKVARPGDISRTVETRRKRSGVPLSFYCYVNDSRFLLGFPPLVSTIFSLSTSSFRGLTNKMKVTHATGVECLVISAGCGRFRPLGTAEPKFRTDWLQTGWLGKDFHIRHTFIPVLRLIARPIQWVPWLWLGKEAGAWSWSLASILYREGMGRGDIHVRHHDAVLRYWGTFFTFISLSLFSSKLSTFSLEPLLHLDTWVWDHGFICGCNCTLKMSHGAGVGRGRGRNAWQVKECTFSFKTVHRCSASHSTLARQMWHGSITTLPKGSRGKHPETLPIS